MKFKTTLTDRFRKWFVSQFAAATASNKSLTSDETIQPETLNIRIDEIYNWEGHKWCKLSISIANDKGTLVIHRHNFVLAEREVLKIADIEKAIFTLNLTLS